jgi:hypothetical protein
MTLDIKKTASTKTMRVATVFTGAAACAVAFTPATGAQAATIQPTTTKGSCYAANRSHWLHVVNTQSTYCVGGEGRVYIAGGFGYLTGVYSFCGGNNSGEFINSAQNAPSPLPFYTGTYYNEYSRTHGGPYYASQVSISRWHGTDTCGL